MTKDSFRDMLNHMKNYHIIRDKIEYDSKYHDELMKMLYGKMKEKYANLETLDGIKAIIDEDSWALIRKSNTENIIRISAESNNLEILKNIHLQIKELIKQSYEKIK
jgi:phosphomannomutase